MQVKRWKRHLMVLGGLLSILAPPGQVRASDTPADMSISVRPVSGVPPADVNTLTVIPGSVEGQAQLNWTAPTVFPGSTLDSYQVRVETFSLASVGGSSTTWWNASGGSLIQGFYGESPGASVTRTLGPPGSSSSHVISLYPGATYYFAVRSADNVGVTYDFWSNASPIVSGSALDVPPPTPTGLSATSGNVSITLSWTDLTPAQKGIDFDGYRLYRSQQSNMNFALLTMVTGTTYTDSSAISGIVYFYWITAIDRGAPNYPGTALESPPSAAIAASISTGLSKEAPLRPNGLMATVGGGQFTLKWHPVTLDAKFQPMTIDHYVVYRYDAIGSSPTVAATVLPGDLSYTDTVGGLTYFYGVVAIAAGNISSALSDYVDSSSRANHYVIAADDLSTRVVIPDALARELNSELNGLGQDLEIRITRRTNDEVDLTLRSYHIGVFRTETGAEFLNFAFSESGMQVQLGLGASLGAVQPNSSARGPLGGSIGQIVSMYWFNGGSFMRISDPVLTSNSSLSVSVKNVGTYQIRVTQVASQFRLTQGSPYPRVITPNDPSQNNRVFWFFDNPSDQAVTGTIYDIRGAKVRDLVVNGQSPTSNSLVWDGRDNRGAVVPSGVYLYKIAVDKDAQTGTVVVAR